MNTYWLAIDTENTSYTELQGRKVVAQGWPQLGDLKTLCKLAGNAKNHEVFKQVIAALALAVGDENQRPQEVMWKLLNLQKGDLIIGIEGTVVKGICQMPHSAADSYRYDGDDAFNYSQTVGFPVTWVDWDEELFGFTPKAPAQSVPGIAGLVNDQDKIIKAWDSLIKGA
ncbi:MAG: hypothetical protein ACH34X_05280 [Thiolinea sp.]